MQTTRRTFALSASLAALAAALVSLAGCDNSAGEGQQASPVKPEEAKSQAQAREEFAKSKPAGKAK